MGHAEKFCNKFFLVSEKFPGQQFERLFDTWLKAPSRRGLSASGEWWLYPIIPNLVETPLKGKVIDKVTVVIVAGKGETSKISGDKNGSSQGKLLDKGADQGGLNKATSTQSTIASMGSKSNKEDLGLIIVDTK